MQIIKIANHIEMTSPMPKDVFISFGKSLRMSNVDKYDVKNLLDKFPTEHYAWYLKIESPFSIVREYTDSFTFLPTTGPCRKIWVIKRYIKTKKIQTLSIWKSI